MTLIEVGRFAKRVLEAGDDSDFEDEDDESTLLLLLPLFVLVGPALDLFLEE